MIYLDNAASTPILPEVKAAMEPFLSAEFGNASSLHAAGRRARKAVEDARDACAAALGADPKEILFTSCATESNNLAIAGAAEALRARGDHIVVSAIEHPCVLETCARLEKLGFRVARVPVDRHGLVDPADVARAVTPATVLISVMWVNNEVGAVQPIAEIRARTGRIPIHTDAVQAVGKVPVSVRDVDLLTFSAHKMHGPKGAGGLFVRKGTPLAPMLVGGGQEFERRAGTENVAAIAGLGAAMKRANAHRDGPRIAALRDRLERGIGAPLNGPPERRAPHILNVSFAPAEAEAVILALDAEGVCVSSGSACASMSLEPSHVLGAMDLAAEVARGSVRFSLSALTTEAEIDDAIEIVPRVIGRLRR